MKSDPYLGDHDHDAPRIPGAGRAPDPGGQGPAGPWPDRVRQDWGLLCATRAEAARDQGRGRVGQTGQECRDLELVCFWNV